jgi:hypothetical protein
MNCPKCERCLGVLNTPDGSPKYICIGCEWESESVNALVLASPAYRLAKLKAAGAKPGWYGPDGERAGFGPLDKGGREFVEWGDQYFTPGEARLCGFVEVR